ncbi:hypothetical protein ACGF0D_43040 [Kitasatospora sp. NPDC048298]|uniref:hypothetical protein n=1 Tax=Kitasatospora sp. NPDC048298 TaxID=3364049 RepID=UPI003710DF44
MTDAPVYILIHPDGRAEWGDRISVAEKAMGSYGVGRGWLTDASLGLRLTMSDCAAIMPEVFPANPYAASVLAHVAGLPAGELPVTRGPVALWAYDPRNEWDSTRAFTDSERALVEVALTAAGCSAG